MKHLNILLISVSILSTISPLLEGEGIPKHPCFSDNVYKATATNIRNNIREVKDPTTKKQILVAIDEWKKVAYIIKTRIEKNNRTASAINEWQKLLSPIKNCYGFNMQSNNFREAKKAVEKIKKLPQEDIFERYFAKEVEKLFTKSFKENGIDNHDRAYNLSENQTITNADIALLIEITKVLEHF